MSAAKKTTEAKFTPGPWVTNGNAIEQQAEPSDVIAHVYAGVDAPSEGSARINARLIAQAPAMFELLQSLHERLMDGRSEVERADMERWAEEIDDVLTAAEG